MRIFHGVGDPIPSSRLFPRFRAAAAAVRSAKLRLDTRCCLLQLLRPFSHGASPSPVGCCRSLNRGLVVASIGSRQPPERWNVARLDSSPLQRPRRARFDSLSSRCFGRARPRAARVQDAPV